MCCNQCNKTKYILDEDGLRWFDGKISDFKFCPFKKDEVVCGTWCSLFLCESLDTINDNLHCRISLMCGCEPLNFLAEDRR